MSLKDLKKLRRIIDEIDMEIIRLLDKRIETAVKIYEIKHEMGMDIVDSAREKDILNKVGRYRDIFEKIIEKSIEEQWRQAIDKGIKSNENIEIGIVGYGKMGKLFTNIFKKHHKINIYDIKKIPNKENKNVIVQENLNELVKKSEYIMIATSITTIHNVAARIRNIIMNNNYRDKVIFDIATLKNKVIKELEKYPKYVRVASTHPMFGGSIKHPWQHKILLLPLKDREEDAKYIERLFKPYGFKIIYTSLEDHDKYMAYTIALPYLLGIIFKETTDDLDPNKLDIHGGTSYRILHNYYEKVVARDKEEFINEILSSKYSIEVINRVLEIIMRIRDEAESG